MRKAFKILEGCLLVIGMVIGVFGFVMLLNVISPCNADNHCYSVGYEPASAPGN